VARLVDAHYRGQSVEQAWPYTLRELAQRRQVARYRPRHGSIDVYIRHNTSDGNILQEFTMSKLYDPPPAVAELIGPAPQIVDLGAHIGLFGAHAFTLWPDATLVAFEPDPGNRVLLERTAQESGKPWTVVAAAAWTENTKVGFRSGGFAASRVDSTSQEQVEAIDVFRYLADADLVKIDIEGAEWLLLADARFNSIPARVVILEWHPEGCPTDDPHREALSLLRSAGYETVTVEGAPPGVGMIWGRRSGSRDFSGEAS
jgi:FkbM family methyltransferase